MMDLTIFEFLFVSFCCAMAGLLTGYELGKDQGYKLGIRRGRAVINYVKEMKK